MATGASSAANSWGAHLGALFISAALREDEQRPPDHAAWSSELYAHLPACGDLPVVAGVPFYSIMGTATHGRTSDGYVTVDSARLPGSVADTLLPIRHQQFDRAAPLNVVYKILRQHADTVASAASGPAPQGCR